VPKKKEKLRKYIYLVDHIKHFLLYVEGAIVTGFLHRLKVFLFDFIYVMFKLPINYLNLCGVKQTGVDRANVNQIETGALRSKLIFRIILAINI